VVVATAFQRQKVAGVFHAMDVNDDDFLEQEDFEALTARWNGVRGYEPGSPDHERMTAIMMGWWAALLSAADQNRDDKVTLDEVMLVVDQLPAMRDQVRATAESMFDAVDRDGDGSVELDEYKEMVWMWKQTDAGTDELFPQLDTDGDGRISKEEFSDLWCGFWIDDDESSPAKWVFGPF
jgi:Ca2+-binding EF-hand superfamily protein